MKCPLTLLLLLFLTNCAFAQYEFIHINDQVKSKGIRVKTLNVYFFETATDSTLTTVNTYDSLGGWLTAKTFLKNGTVAGFDTCIYDEHHYPVKLIRLENNKIKHEVLNTNDANGKLIHTKTIGDSIYNETVSTYNVNGQLVKMKIYFGNDDTTTINNFYNHKGLLIKTVSFSKQNGETVTSREYNAFGKMTTSKDTYPTFGSVTELRYNPNNNLVESNAISIYDNKEIVTRTIYTHYSNGMNFERILVVNSKAISLEKIYYTYY